MPIYMKIEGIDGDVTVEGYERWLAIMSWSWGETNQGTHAGGGGGAGKVSMLDFSFVKQCGKGSPQLMYQCATGRHLPAVQFVHTAELAESQIPIQIWTLRDCQITSYAPGGDGQSVPLESMSLNFTKLEFKQAVLGRDGRVERYQTATWDVARGTGSVQP